MHIDPELTLYHFTSLGNSTQFPEEQEVLFSIQTIFRVDTIDFMSADRIQNVRLSLTYDNNPELRNLMEYIRRELNGQTPMHRLGQFLIDLEEWSKAKDIYETILEQTNINNTNQMTDLHHQLGYIADKLKSPKDAMYHYQQVFKFDSNLPKNKCHRLTSTYGSIGRLFYRNKQFDESLDYYNKAVQLALIASNIDKTELGIYYNNMALIFQNQCCYDKALTMFEKSLNSKGRRRIRP
jgi:tetratricopeptide (TPR) repeat protein